MIMLTQPIKYNCKRIFLCILFLLFFSTSFANWIPIICHFTPKNYGAGTQNWDMVEQVNGWMYVANNYGLLETDGCHWNLYGISNSTAVRAITTDRDGNIYVGGTDEFGVFSSNGLGGLTYKPLSVNIPERYRQFGEVWRLQIENNKLYVQTRHYIFVYTEDNIEVLDPGAIIYESLVWEGNLYVATSRDLFVQSGGILHTLRGAEAIQNSVVCGLIPYGKEGMLIATDFQGLYIYDGKSINRFYTEADDYIIKNQLYTIAVSHDKIALGTVQGGVVIADLNGKNCKYITREEGLQNNTILSLLFDSQQNLWMGLDNGIDVLETTNPILFYRDPNLDYGSGYTSCEHEGKLYLGTNQGIYVQPAIDASLQFIDGSNGQVWKFSKVGETLFCCHNRGLFIINDTHLYPLDCNDGVWKVTALSDSTAIVGTYVGFYYLYLSHGKWQLQFLQGFSETVLYHEIDAQGNIWLLTSRGIERLSVDLSTSKVHSELIIGQVNAPRIYSLTKWQNKVLITSDDYCAVVDTNGVLSTDSSILSNLAGTQRYLNITEDIHKNIWYIYDNLIAVRTYDSLLHTYQKENVALYNSSILIDGFSNLTPSMYGGVVIGGVDGFYWMNPATTQHKREENIYIRRVSTLTDSPQILYGESYQHDIKSIVIPAAYRALRIQFSGSNALENAPLFRTRLHPLEESFTPWQQESHRDFIGLPIGGDYQLEVEMLSTLNGEIRTRTVPILLEYPFCFTWWAKVIYILLIISIMSFASWRIYRNVQNSKKRLAEEKNKEINQQQMRILQLENEKAQFDLRNKSQELSNMLLSEANRKEWNEDVHNEIRRIVDCLNNDRIAEAKGKMQHLQHRLARNEQTSINWKRFEENFDIVNNQFIARLSKHYPWMSKQERKLCVYIHIGLSSKEIAPLLNISVRAVEMMRYRIRNKMQIDSSISLKQHFYELQSKE